MLALVEYQALYRKYRPQRFSEIIGQGHVTETLSREIIDHGRADPRQVAELHEPARRR
jgi:DNA polymerase III gamma/tau subunit